MSKLQEIGIEVGFWLAGTFGAILGLRKIPNDTPWYKKILNVASGTITAGYMTPFVNEFIHPKSSISYSIAFFVGYVGLQLVDVTWNSVSKLISSKRQ